MSETSVPLNTPVISAVSNGLEIIVSGLDDSNASGYAVRLGTIQGYGIETEVTPIGGSVSFSDNRPRMTYYLQAKALGDSINYADSSWSSVAAVVTGADEEDSIPVPILSPSDPTFTSITFGGLATDLGIRYRLAGSAAALASAQPFFGGTDAAGVSKILGLNYGSDYFVQACYVRGKRCGGWSAPVSFSTEDVIDTQTVTSSANQGTGTLRDIMSKAVSGTRIVFDSSLSGATIALSSALQASGKKLLIDGTTLNEKITISGNMFGASNNDNVFVVGVICAASIYSKANYVDCVISGSISASSAIYAPVTSCRCDFSGFTSAIVLAAQSFHYGNYLPSGADSSTCVNCFFTGKTSGTVANACNLSGCTITRNTTSNGGMVTGNGRIVETDILNNTLTGGTFRVVVFTNVYSCRVVNNTCSMANNPAYNGTAQNVCVDTVFSGNTGGTTDEVGTGQFVRCIISGSGSHAVTSLNPVLKDCLVLGNAPAGVFSNCTVTKAGGTANNCLLGPGSLVSGGNNLIWDETDSSSDTYVDKIFVNFAEGDYRLASDSPALDSGDDAFVGSGDLDLDGNPRIMGTHVDIGAYEYVLYKLAPPVFSVEIDSGGQGTISFTLPPHASAFLLQYADNPNFTNAQEISSSSTGIVLSGMSGLVYFRAKSVGAAGSTIDSDWSATQSAFFDVTAPIVIIDKTPIEMTVGDTVDFLEGVIVVDNLTGDYPTHYQVIDSNGDPVEVDGETTDIRSSGIPKGAYTLVITASDAAGNVGSADRQLIVAPPILPTPVISIDSSGKYSVTLAGLYDINASGWLLKQNGLEKSVSPDSDGMLTVSGLGLGTTYLFQAKALGNWIQPPPPAQPSGDYRSSAWSNQVSFTTQGAGAFYRWQSDILLSHKDRTFQNMEVRAKILDKDTGEVMPPTAVGSAVFTAYYIECGRRVALEEFTEIAVPSSAFLAAADEEGFNFRFIPDQTVKRLFARPGYYVLEVIVTPTAGNPFNVYSEPIPVF